MEARQVFEGGDAWRNGFTANAADLLQCVRWGAKWNDETFRRVLIIIARRTRGERTNCATVDKVLGILSRDCPQVLTTDRV